MKRDKDRGKEPMDTYVKTHQPGDVGVEGRVVELDEVLGNGLVVHSFEMQGRERRANRKRHFYSISNFCIHILSSHSLSNVFLSLKGTLLTIQSFFLKKKIIL